MAGQFQVNPERLRRLANDLDQVTSLLDTAQRSVLDSEISSQAFSPSGQPLAYAFLGAIELAGNDAFEQAAQIASIQERLVHTAEQWERAEEASTVHYI